MWHVGFWHAVCIQISRPPLLKIVGADFGIWDGCGVRVGLLFPVWLGLVFLDWIPLGCLDLLVLGFVIGELVLGRFGSVLACLLHV